ncbi:MAG: hypothetical protein EP323_08125 [Gammaproteobacteria bacterium]|nr:MAG: hypothetical protein EP323_08125 [Gammaproteobacteria bacterium]
MIRKPKTLLSYLVLLASTCMLPSASSHAEQQTAEIAAEVVGAVLFNEAEKRLFGDYLTDRYREDHDGYKQGKTKKLPPGLRKKLERGGELPPGWQQKVARGEVLDMDVYRYSQDLPEDLLHRLPRDIDGTSLRRIDDRIVRIMDATRTILDVFYLTTGH